MTAKPLTWTPPRYKRRLLLAAIALCFGLCWWAMRSSSKAVDLATKSIAPDGECGVVWIGWLRGCKGLVLLELAGSQAVADPIAGVIRGAGATEAAVRNVELDYLLIICYVGLLAVAASAVASLNGVWQLHWLRRMLLAVALLQVVAGALDGLENVGLFIMVRAPSVPPGVAERTFWVSAIKWWLIGIGIVVPLLAYAGWLVRARWRSSGP